ncbi:MAG: flagellar biosynthesis protein FlhF [Gammaproteobacteria bacterium]|nr:flagellar biosynthesis protein FlhF [Gammaproteobacteria bacterium]
MKINRYIAASMRLALAKVREEQGPEAVILSSRRLEEGVEVIAAVDYDESLLAEGGRRQEPAGAPAARTPTARARPAAASGVDQAGEAGEKVPAAEPARAVTRAQPDPAYLAMRREIEDMRRLLAGGLANLGWQDARAHEPLKARVIEELSALDVTPDVAARLAKLAPPASRVADPSAIPLALLARHLPLAEDGTCESGGVTAVVGPTGVGKTTTVAKLAARWCMRHGADEIALVSADGYRIGAREQLATYARILGVPMHAADGARELGHLLDRLRQKRLVLIDTAGFGPRDRRLLEQIEMLKSGAPRARRLLALPAQGEAHALEDAVNAFAPLAPAACILTKIDEAASLGAALSTAIRHALPIAYLCNGQRVPEDLHSAHRRRVWLVRAASQLRRGSPTRRDDHYFARHFSGVESHA